MSITTQPKRAIPPQLLATIAQAIPSLTHADRRRFVNKFMRPADEDIHRESPRCPRCKSRRTWQPKLAEGDARFRCREDGVRFVPEPEPEPEATPEPEPAQEPEPTPEVAVDPNEETQS